MAHISPPSRFVCVFTPAVVPPLITCQRGAWELPVTCVLEVKSMIVFMNEWMDEWTDENAPFISGLKWYRSYLDCHSASR